MAVLHHVGPFLLLILLTISLLERKYFIQAQLLSTGLTVTFNGIYYFISPYSVGNVSVDTTKMTSMVSVLGFYPVTVIQQEGMTTQDIQPVLQNFTAQDDVYQIAFSQVVLSPNAATRQITLLEGGSCNVLGLDSPDIPSGPYFLEAATGSLYSVYRLYSDYAGAFTESLIQAPDGTFSSLSAQIPGTASLTVGVPSRLYYTPTADKPLAGVRVGIKDIFDLAGAKTSDGNRAWYNLYPAAKVTALSMQRLIDAGAIVVGHQKPSQFANGEEATADWVDYHSPFNPRGDGYQDPSSSSSGGGASIGSYEWLDIAVGSDTGGSIRGPAGSQGVFGNRPSHGLVALDGVMPLSPVLDTAGFLTRDPILWDAAQAVLYSTNYTNPKPTGYPTKIYTYEYPTNASDSDSDAVLVKFISQLSSFLSASVSEVNLTALWSKSPPAGASSSLDTVLNITYPILISQQQTPLVRDPFYADYAAIHDGRLPFVDPVPLVRWAFGDSYPTSATQDAINNKTLFMDWFNTNILPRSQNAEICSDAMFIYVGSSGDEPAPRNEYLDPPEAPYGFSAGRISVFTECPDSAFPIGQVATHSNITNHDEYLPVVIDILVAKGCDALLPKLAQDLVQQKIIPMPETGQTIYGGDVLLKKRSVADGKETFRYIG